jgi:hypothetical protein
VWLIAVFYLLLAALLGVGEWCARTDTERLRRDCDLLEIEGRARRERIDVLCGLNRRTYERSLR